MPTALRKMMASCPSHARLLSSDVGPCVLTQLPGAQGRYDSEDSVVRLLPVASLDRLTARIEAMGKRLDKAYEANKALERRVALLTCVSSERW